MIGTTNTLPEERSNLKYITKSKLYLASVASYVREQSSEVMMSVNLGNDIFQLSAPDLLEILQGVDADLDNMKTMSELIISELSEASDESTYDDEFNPPPRLKTIPFVITDNDCYRATGRLITRIGDLFLAEIERSLFFTHIERGQL